MDKVFVGIPTHDSRVYVGTAECVVPRMIGSVEHKVKMQARSLLAENFNSLWCQALNGDYTHFCLLHADIGVTTQCWAEKMLGIMKREKVDVLSVLSPIKNTNDYSCGLGNADCKQRIRFSRDDIAKLPATFNTADCRKVFNKPEAVMIFNTGVLMFRLNKVDPIKMPFRMADVIGHDSSGNYVQDCIPEDWFFSTMCYHNGISYACTREISLLHAGSAGWSNQI